MGIKLLDPKKTFEVVSLSDDAIDTENSDLIGYQTNYDMSLLKFLPDSVPTIFVIQNVMSTDTVTIQQEHYVTEIPEIKPGMTPEQIKNQKIKVTPVKTGEMLIKYFKAGVVSMKNGNEVTQMTSEIVEQVPPLIIQELGSLIMLRSTPSAGKKK